MGSICERCLFSGFRIQPYQVVSITGTNIFPVCIGRHIVLCPCPCSLAFRLCINNPEYRFLRGSGRDCQIFSRKATLKVFVSGTAVKQAQAFLSVSVHCRTGSGTIALLRLCIQDKYRTVIKAHSKLCPVFIEGKQIVFRIDVGIVFHAALTAVHKVECSGLLPASDIVEHGLIFIFEYSGGFGPVAGYGKTGTSSAGPDFFIFRNTVGCNPLFARIENGILVCVIHISKS